jgi:hypothetical protein
MDRRQTVVALLLTAAVFGAGVWMLGSRLGLTPHSRQFRGTFATVRAGMSEGEVIERLGAPDERTAEFRLGQRKGNEHEYANAARSGADHYLLWRRDGHMIYAVGFDRRGVVCYAGSGGT